MERKSRKVTEPNGLSMFRFNLRCQRKSNRGWSGRYFKISRSKGVKVIPNRTLLVSEVKRLKRFNKKYPGLFPTYHKTEKVFVGTKQFTGIVMEHIAGKSGWELTRSKFKKKILPKLPKNLVKEWSDCYRGNVILVGKRVRCIDAGRKLRKPDGQVFKV